MSRAAYLDAQWWADQGYLVVIADGRGTTGRGPVWDREVYLQMKRVSLADQVDAVHALAGAVDELNRMGGAAEGCEFGGHDDAARPLPKPDLERVAMIGWSYGGFLSALAVLDAPDAFAAACAGAPPTDWTLYDTHTPSATWDSTRPRTNVTASSRTRRNSVARLCSSTVSPTTM